MIPTVAPLADQFDELLQTLSFDQVSSWDMRKRVSYCVNKLAKEKSDHYDLDNLIEDYEEFHGHSIVKAIDDWHFNGNQSWRDYESVEYLTFIRADNDSLETVKPDKINDDCALSWGIFLRNRINESICVLNVVNVDEARLITESIHRHYFTNPIAKKQLKHIAELLSNDENSIDNKLREIMVKLELRDQFIDQALALRNSFFKDPYLVGLELNANNQLEAIKYTPFP